MKDIGMTFFLTICTSYLYTTEATVVVVVRQLPCHSPPLLPKIPKRFSKEKSHMPKFLILKQPCDKKNVRKQI
jgi:hypothetical protein